MHSVCMCIHVRVSGRAQCVYVYTCACEWSCASAFDSTHFSDANQPMHFFTSVVESVILLHRFASRLPDEDMKDDRW